MAGTKRKTSHRFNAEGSLTRAQLRELERSVKDARDPRRYVIKSVLLPSARKPWEMYYDVSADCWAMRIEHGTLFKRKKTARAVADLVEDPEHVRVEEVTLHGEQIRRKKVKHAPHAAKSTAPARRRRSSRHVQASKGRW